MMNITLDTTRVMTPLGIGTVVNRVVSPQTSPTTRLWLIRFDRRDFHQQSEYDRTFPSGGNCRFRSFSEDELSEVSKSTPSISTTSTPSTVEIGSAWESLKTGKKFILKVITSQGLCKLGLHGSSDYYEVSLKNLESRYRRI